MAIATKYIPATTNIGTTLMLQSNTTMVLLSRTVHATTLDQPFLPKNSCIAPLRNSVMASPKLLHSPCLHRCPTFTTPKMNMEIASLSLLHHHPMMPISNRLMIMALSTGNMAHAQIKEKTQIASSGPELETFAKDQVLVPQIWISPKISSLKSSTPKTMEYAMMLTAMLNKLLGSEQTDLNMVSIILKMADAPNKPSASNGEA